MIQEIITYMILGSAITLAIIKVRNRFWRKKRELSSPDSNSKKTTLSSHCSNCVADCTMRDVSQQSIQYNNDLCNKIESKSN